MLRYFVCLLLVAGFAAKVCAETVLDRKKMKSGTKNDYDDPVYDQHNMFEFLNKDLLHKLLDQQQKIKADPKAGRDPNKILQAVPTSAGAICPICQQKLARHGDPGFRCLPIDPDTGKPIPVAEITWRRVQCPVCSAQFRSAMPGNINRKGGIDHDFCLHSIGRASVYSNVWTCPDCGYAALIESFGLAWDQQPISEETKRFVETQIKPVMFQRMCKIVGIKDSAINKPDPHGLKQFHELFQEDDWQMAQDQINDWIKYDNAIKIYKQQKAPHNLMARLYLEAAYACRREINGEIAIPSLLAEIEERLSLSIRRINHDLTAATIQIRHSHGQSALIDPNKAETDAAILAEAAELIVRMGELTGERIRQENRQPDAKLDPNQFYSSGDMFILCLRYAGFLDRLGRMDPAARLLSRAKSFIANPRAEDQQLPPHMAEFVNKQLDQIRGYVDSRQKCLEFERECLNRAMWENLVAIHHKGVRFIDSNHLLAPPAKDQLDPAMTAYMIGELARRTGEPGAGIAFLAAADAILVRQIKQLAKEEDALDKNAPANKAAVERLKDLDTRWTFLRAWTAEQLKEALQPRKDETVSDKLDDTAKVVLYDVLEAGGVEAASFKIPAAVPQPENATNAVPAVPKEKAAAVEKPVSVKPVATNAIKTREELYKMYYEAIARYSKEKQVNPPSLPALVEAGYVTRENACLSDSGKFIICPETHEPIQYVRSFTLGDRMSPVLFQTSNARTTKILFANGDIRLLTDK